MTFHTICKNHNNNRHYPGPVSVGAIFMIVMLLLASVVMAAGSLVATWDPVGDSDLAGYKVYYGTTSGDYENWQMTDVGNVTQYILNDLVVGQRYYLVVTAYDFAGNESGYSTQVDAVATSRSVSIQYTAANGLVISWDSVSGADSYQIFKSSNAYFTPGTPAATQTGTQYVDSGFDHTADVGSYYIIRALSGGNELYSFSRVGALNIKVRTGRNLVSVPFINSDSSLTAVLGSQLTGSSFSSRADKVYMWNGSDYEMAWLVEGTSSPYEGKWMRKAGDMESSIRLRPEKSFWVEVNSQNPVPTDSVITVCGRVKEEANQNYTLQSGPNFVASGYPVDVPLSESGLAVSGAVSGGPSGAVADKVMHWRGTNNYDVAWLVSGSGTSWDGEWMNERGDALSGMSFKAGHGYIIMIKNDNTVTNWQFPKPN